MNEQTERREGLLALDDCSFLPSDAHPCDAHVDAARTAGFTAAEWDAYILAGIALQNERGALAVAEQRGEQHSIRAFLELTGHAELR